MTDDIQDRLRLLIRELLGMPDGSVRPADANQPTEGDAYAILQVSELESTGWAGDRQTGIATITLDFFGDMAKTHVWQLAQAMQSHYATETLLALDMGLIDVGQARDLTALEMDRVSRYQTTMRLSYACQWLPPNTLPNDVINAPNIEQVPIGLIAEP